jgi:predicted PP-loop superfamily ATPase
MAILRERVTWKKPKDPTPRALERLDELSPEQRANVRKAMDVMHIRFGGWPNVARAMKVGHKALVVAMKGPRKPTAVLAVRVAQLAGVTVDDVLTGAFPKPGACPMCGRCE